MVAHTTNDSMKADAGAGLDRLHATLALDAPVTSVKLVSATRAKALGSAMGISTVRDLLTSYPLRYVDMSQVAHVQSAQVGTKCTVVGHVYEIKRKNPRPRLSIVEISVVDETGLLMVTCFNQPWLMDSLEAGKRISVSGTVEFNYGFKRMTNPLIVEHAETDDVEGLVLPIHPATAKVSRTMMRRLVTNALSQVKGLYDPLPLSLRKRYKLYSRWQALRGVHAPVSLEDAQAARRRLRYEELFFLELELVQREQERAAQHEPFCHTTDGASVRALRTALPFELTADQQQAVSDIFERMAADYPMSHLLLGDVGTGKTVVAAFALAAAADSDNQAFMMGPTEVLARQYGTALGSLLDTAGIRWALLTGSTPVAEKQTIIAGFAAGEIQVLFGTHALLEDDVVPKQCSLVCIDEQQRFGVDQRERLIAKAPGADILSMTATPIPRSLALARYGGLTLSYLHAAPARQGGRTTRVCHFSEEGIAYDALRAALNRGEQAYVICPLIGIKLEDDAKQEEQTTEAIEYATIEWGLECDDVGDTLSAATKHAEVLKTQVVPNARVELLHGRMATDEKADVMRRFREGEIDVLVSTTVVEVGVDVPNATVMIIEDADRFGLAQLHQLRGRVGRGTKPGEVFLVSRSRAEEALERLAIMESTEDGFKLSEKDLALRREGDIFGERQHGKSPLRLVNVVRDAAVIEAAYEDARAVAQGNIPSEDEMSAVMREMAVIRNARSQQ